MRGADERVPARSGEPTAASVPAWPPALFVPLPAGPGTVVVPPPGEGAGFWSGAPSAIMHDGEVWLAYRLRRPVGYGRGYANVVARSSDGLNFRTVSVIGSVRFSAESLERPALAVTADGRWRLYVSCATPGTKHWRVDVVEAGDPADFEGAPARTALPGNDSVAVKDPVVLRHGGMWHVWASCHPIDRPADADRMTTCYATSRDGLSWQWHGTVLSGSEGGWDSRGTRVTAVLVAGDGLAPAVGSEDGDDRMVAYYDGRASAAENWEERTGLAYGTLGSQLLPAGTKPAAVGSTGSGSLRYVSAVHMPDGSYRLYYEAARDDGGHELRTETVTPPS